MQVFLLYRTLPYGVLSHFITGTFFTFTPERCFGPTKYNDIVTFEHIIEDIALM